MKHAVSRELFAYWNQLRKGRAAPERADIDPAAIRGALSDTFIVGATHVGSQPVFPVRLAGTRLNALFLTELKGRNLVDQWEPSDRTSVERLLQVVLDEATPLVAGLRGSAGSQRPVDLEMILLPLRHHGRTHARILGAIAPLAMPSWLGLMAVDRLSLVSLRHIDPASDPPVIARGLQPEPPRIEAPPRRYGRFTVHEGGR